MIKLNVTDLAVDSFATAPGGDTVTDTMLMDTDPRACPATQGWNECTNITAARGCETGGCANC